MTSINDYYNFALSCTKQILKVYTENNSEN